MSKHRFITRTRTEVRGKWFRLLFVFIFAHSSQLTAHNWCPFMDLSPTYIEHFQAPKNIGDVEEPRVLAEVAHQGSGCHDRLRVTLRINDGIVEDAMWRARACSGTVAAASAATEWAKGKSVEEVTNVTPGILIDVLDGIPEKKMHSVELVAEALQKAASTSI
ncbi:MAG TPA: hypothetical protein ENH10_01965 [Bacteroidetes bacterium]|nr:hypothetical protein [Bacteroidota bacterium]HEX03907.1 hypothetical protein [Bacteroidota bacterium]